MTERTEDQPVDLAEALSETYDSLETPRDDAGRFAAKNPTEEAPAEQASAPEETTDDDQTDKNTPDDEERADADKADEAKTAEADGESEAEPVEAPEHWSDEDKATFASAPPEVQKWMVERHKAMEADHTRKTQEAAEFRRSVEPLHKVAQHWDRYFQQVGMTPDKAFNYLVGAEYQLRTGTPEQKRTMIEQLKRDYGISDDAGDGDDEYTDPQIASLNKQIEALTSKLNEREQQDMAMQQQSLAQQVESFKAETDADGKPMHPYFEDVKEDMAGLLQAGRAADLKEAYDKAVWANPETRTKQMAAEREAEKAKTAVEAKTRADKARKAQGVKSTSAPGGKSPPGSLHDALSEAYDRVVGGA